MTMHLSYYEVLGVDQGATAEEVKAAYQKLALNCHPDKAGDDSQGRFQELQQAWQILRDPEARTLYNHQLSQAQLKATVVLHDEIQLEDMECADEPCDAGTEGQNETASHSYPCRCGDSYILTAADIRLAAAVGQEIIVPCRSCSNHILVKLPS